MSKKVKKTKWVMVSGGFDPVHVGHVRMFNSAKMLGDKLVVVINGDSWLKRKKGKGFMKAVDRAEIIRSFRSVDEVYVLNSKKDDVCEAIKLYEPAIFANGGDRKSKNTPEVSLCNEMGIELAFNVGGKKIRSSSELLKAFTI